MASKKIISLSLLFIPAVFGINTSISAQDIPKSENSISEIVLVDTQNDYDVYAEQSEVGYLQVTVID